MVAITGWMTVVHDATIDDQRLDLYSLELQHWWQIIAICLPCEEGDTPLGRCPRLMVKKVGFIPADLVRSIMKSQRTHLPNLSHTFAFWFLDDLISQ